MLNKYAVLKVIYSNSITNIITTSHHIINTVQIRKVGINEMRITATKTGYYIDYAGVVYKGHGAVNSLVLRYC